MSEYRKEIMQEVEKVQNRADLLALLDKLESKQHDYNTVVEACYAAMKAAFNVFNRGSQGGITGFQAGFVGWRAVQDFMITEEDAPLRIVNYNDLLYPQYQHKFEKTITRETWEHLQNKAKACLSNLDGYSSERVRNHWQSIVDGVVPFGFTVKDE